MSHAINEDYYVLIPVVAIQRTEGINGHLVKGYRINNRELMTMDWTRIGVNELTRHALSEERLDIVAYAFPVMAGIAHTIERELETVMTG